MIVVHCDRLFSVHLHYQIIYNYSSNQPTYNQRCCQNFRCLQKYNNYTTHRIIWRKYYDANAAASLIIRCDGDFSHETDFFVSKHRASFMDRRGVANALFLRNQGRPSLNALCSWHRPTSPLVLHPQTTSLFNLHWPQSVLDCFAVILCFLPNISQDGKSW